MDMGYLWLVQVLALELEELKDKDYWQLVATLAKSKEMASPGLMVELAELGSRLAHLLVY